MPVTPTYLDVYVELHVPRLRMYLGGFEESGFLGFAI
jgi:hypothetical protein